MPVEGRWSRAGESERGVDPPPSLWAKQRNTLLVRQGVWKIPPFGGRVLLGFGFLVCYLANVSGSDEVG